MPRNHADLTSLILQMLQDTTPSIYDSTETAYWIIEGLTEIARYDPHIVEVPFKIESRSGSDTAGTASSLTDTTKSQFVSTDDDYEKVIHNTTDNTWAVVTDQTSTSVLVLSADIMDSAENYEIYNKRCWNNKQIYIGDVTDYLWVDSVEYPVGTKRNWKIYGDILEIMVDSVADSDLTQTTLPDIDVLVRFAKPHKVPAHSDLAGACSATEPVGETTIAVKDIGTTDVVAAGEEFTIADMRYTYTVVTGDTMESGAGELVVFPGVEAATADGDVITFVTSTLQPHQEEILCQLVAARAVLSDNIRHINAIPKGGPNTWRNYQEWGERKLAETIGKLTKIYKPRTKRTYPRS